MKKLTFTLSAYEGASYPSSSHISESEVLVPVIHVSGPLSRNEWWDGVPTMYLVDVLRTLDADSRVSNIIIDWHSPGGEAAAVAPVLAYLSTARRSRIYSSVEMAASAAYWIASGTDAIFMQNDLTAHAGSIGAMISWADWKKYYEHKGLPLHDVYSSQSPHKNHMSRSAEQGDFAPMQEYVDDVASRFHASVTSLRPEIKKEALTGGIYIGQRAVDMGLADGILSLYELISRLENNTLTK